MHTYATHGTHTATVTATNAAGSTVTTTEVTVLPNPIVGLVASSDSPTIVGQTTTLTATATSGTEPITYEWAFGDGTSGTGAVTTHAYLDADTYTATVTATNPAGVAVATTLVYVSEVPPDPIVGLAATNDGPTSLGEETTVTATVTGGTPPISYAWNFGDGSMGTGVTTTHTYAGVGVFTATVTATNAAGPAVATTIVTVSQAKLFLPLVVRPATPPNLVVTSITVTPSSPVAGTTATVRVTVLNQGGEDLAIGNNFFVDFYVDRVPSLGAIGDISWGGQGVWFASGASHTFESAHQFQTAGVHQLYAQADTDNNVAEGNESDNTLGPQPLTVLP